MNCAAKWMKPPVGFWKCNFDVALFMNNSERGSGMVIRDYQGAFVYAIVAQVQGPFHGEALVVEALCLKEALSWIKELGLENVLVESDALGVVQLLQSSVQ